MADNNSMITLIVHKNDNLMKLLVNYDKNLHEPTEFNTLTTDELIKINDTVIEIYGGKKTEISTTKKSELDSIIYPQILEYLKDIPNLKKICIIFINILTFHKFSDGNKRTAWIAFELMLYKNNLSFYSDISDGEKFKLLLNIINDNLNFDEVYAKLKNQIIPTF